MEVAGSAVGIISLGIEVCKGLVAYYASWKGFEQDISTTLSSIESIEKVLNVLNQAMVGKKFNKDILEQVEASIASCEGGIQSLNKKLKKFNQTTVAATTSTSSRITALKEKARMHGLRALYPFKESTLAKLRETIHDLKLNLSLAVAALQLDIGSTSLDLLNDIDGKVNLLAGNVGAINTSLNSDRAEKAFRWLNNCDHVSSHHAARRKHEPTTGEWFLQSQEFKTWKSSPNSILWLYSSPGCGKTILCSSVIENITQLSSKQPSISMAYFYFSFSDTRKQMYLDLISSLTVQLSRDRPSAKFVQELHEKHQAGLPPTYAVEECLTSIVKSASGDVFILMDALDECPADAESQERSDALKWLEDIQQLALSNLHIFVTSRKELDIETVFQSLNASSVCIESARVRDDIKKYVEGQMAADRRLKSLDSNTRVDIVTTLVDKANGMFRWVFCQIEELKRLKLMRPRDIKATLESLPKTLDETYDVILSRIEEKYFPEAHVALQWLAFSLRPLELEELAEACIVNPERDVTVDIENRFEPAAILDILSSLVTVSTTIERRGEGPKKIVLLAHFSVKEYIVSERIKRGQTPLFSVEESLTHSYITKSCILYIMNYADDARKSCSQEDLNKYPLLKYSGRFWSAHFKACSTTDNDALTALAVRFMSEDNAYVSALRIYSPDSLLDREFNRAPVSIPPLYYCCLVGLDKLVEALLRSGADPQKGGGRQGSALYAASTKGYEKLIQILLDHGADVNERTIHYNTPLQAAAANGNYKAVKELLARGAGVNSTGGFHGTALAAASLHGSTEILELLLKNGADVNFRGGYHGSALHAASFAGKRKVAEALIASGAAINWRSDRGTALSEAIAQGHVELVHLLIAESAEGKDAKMNSMLFDASWNDDVKTIRHIIKCGVDVNVPAEANRECPTALHAAVRAKSRKVLDVLLDNGAIITSSKAKDGKTILEDAIDSAVSYDSLDLNEYILKALIRNGACKDVQMCSRALFRTIINKFNNLARLLLDNGADVNMCKDGKSALMEAVLHTIGSPKSALEMVALLLERGANVNSRFPLQFGTALEVAAHEGAIAAAKILVVRGADLTAKNRDGLSLCEIAEKSGKWDPSDIEEILKAPT